ncbi:MAG: competence protein CoiA family protein [Simkaniaceae bacterium]|nr:competence protein CoiA family protein [Simkaniaceae bacterium]
MQLFAYEEGEGPSRQVAVREAIKGRNYGCPECFGRLRVKEGNSRRKHFFHCRLFGSCRQARKSAVHLFIQEKICHLLPEGEAIMERRFDGVGRVADVFWVTKRLVMEVQCSSISAEEVRCRNEDYGRAGCRVVWFLHDVRFNGKRPSEAERMVRCERSAFFVRASVSGTDKGDLPFFYDQKEWFAGARRVGKGTPLPVLPGDMPRESMSPEEFSRQERRVERGHHVCRLLRRVVTNAFFGR